MHTCSTAALNLVRVAGVEGREGVAFNRVEPETDWIHREGAFFAIILFFLFYQDMFYIVPYPPPLSSSLILLSSSFQAVWKDII
jgi:hypothetical protein